MLYSKNGGEYMAKILIVEDDKRTNMAICEYLKPTGHNIVSAYDGEEALQLFHSTTIDLIVLDIMLPRLTGIAVLHEIEKAVLYLYLCSQRLRMNIRNHKVLMN